MRLQLETEGATTPLGQEHGHLGSSDHYVCVERHADQIKRAREFEQKLRRTQPSRLLGTIEFDHTDIFDCTYPAHSFDVVICADIISAPSPHTFEHDAGRTYERGCYGFLTLSKSEKQRILAEGFRLLKPTGILIVTVIQTPHYAYALIPWLREHYTLERSYGTIEPRGYWEMGMWDGVFRTHAPRKGHRPLREQLSAGADQWLSITADDGAPFYG